VITYVHHKTGKQVTKRSWTKQDVERLAELAAAGRTLEDMARELGRDSIGSVRSAMRLYEIEHHTVHPRRRWTTAEDSELEQLGQQGLNAQQIAALMPGRNAKSVTRRRNELGLGRLPRQAVPFDLEDPEDL
jgi:hypothetical protein